MTWSLAVGGLQGVEQAYMVDQGDLMVDAGEVLTFAPRTALREAFKVWSDAADITFAEVADDGASVGQGLGADIRIYFGPIDGQGNGSTVGIAFFPPVAQDALSGDILFDAADVRFFSNRNSFLNTAIQEIGYSIGLDHIGGVRAVMNPVATNLTRLLADDIEEITTVYDEPSGGPLSVSLLDGQTDLRLRQRIDDLTITGNDLDNAIKGAGGSELIVGGAGDDQLRGAGGFDTLVGGAGDDVMVGGGRMDLAVITAGFDMIGVSQDGAFLVVKGEGADSLAASTELVSLDGELRQTEDLLALFGTFEIRGASELLRAYNDGARVAGEGGAD